jgi:hypothetical protein
MIDFVNSLEAQITMAAQRQAAGRPVRHRGRRTTLALGVAALVAAIVVSLGLSLSRDGTSPASAALPILKRPGVDVSSLRRDFGTRLSLDLTSGHPFKTPHGTGYVLSSSDGTTLCLAVPDTIDGYGSSCEALSTVQRSGLVGTLVSPSPRSGASEVVIVLPQGTDAATLTTKSGKTSALAIEAGVAVGTIAEDGHVTYDTPRGPRTIAVEAFEPDNGPTYVGCKGGRTFRVPSPKDAIGAARRRYCGDES